MGATRDYAFFGTAEPREPGSYVMDANMPRKISVKAFQGEHATVVVRVAHGTVWLSISPPFTWEAIMTPGMVDEVVGVLKVAREEAALYERRPDCPGKRV